MYLPPGPEDPAEYSRWEKAMIAQVGRRFDTAAALWEIYSEFYPSQADAHSNRSVCLINAGQLEEGLRAARKAHRMKPSRFSRTVLIETLHANGLAAEHEKEARTFTEDFPEDFHGWSSLGRAVLERGDLANAEVCFRRTVELEPEANFAWVQLGSIYFATGRYTESLDAFGKAQASVSTRPVDLNLSRHEALMGMGWSLLMLDKPDRALILAEQAESLNVDIRVTQRLKARCLLSMDHPAGLTTGENALRLGCSDDYLKARIAYEHGALGNTVRANELIAALKPLPEDTDTLNMYAGALALTGKTQEAVAELEALDGILEPYVRLNSLGGALKLAGDFEGAERACRAALEIRRDRVILTNLGELLNELDRYDEAEPLFEEALRISAKFPEALLGQGRAKAGLGKVGEARKYLKLAIESDNLRSVHKDHGTRLLERIDSEEDFHRHLKEQDIVAVHHKEIERLTERSTRQDTLRYEEECARLVRDQNGKHRWYCVETGKKIRHMGNEREADVYGLSRGESGETVCIGECKLKTANTVSYEEMKRLVGRMALVSCIERHDKKRPVKGVFFASTPYDEDARDLARKHKIKMYRVLPEKKWLKRADWIVRPPIEVT